MVRKHKNLTPGSCWKKSVSPCVYYTLSTSEMVANTILNIHMRKKEFKLLLQRTKCVNGGKLLPRGRFRGDNGSQEKTEAEVGGTWPRAKERSHPQKLEEAGRLDRSLKPADGAALSHLSSRPLATRMAGENICIVLSPPI